MVTVSGLVRYVRIILLAVSVFTIGVSHAQNNSKLLIAAASDLKYALDSITTIFRGQNPGAIIEVIYGSSGKLFEQISNQAPFDLFFSADVEYPKLLAEKNLTASEIHSYGKGRIVLWSKKFNPDTDKMNLLTKNAVKKIAIANPLHAPYGKRAEEALKFYKLIPEISSKLVYGENISQTAQYATTGAADAAIVALSLALSPAMKSAGGKYYLIPESSHQPLEQGFVILKHGGANKQSIQFSDFMKTKEVKGILSYFGFTDLKK